MNVLVILAHPNPGSFNHAIADAAVEKLRQNGHTVQFHDLYREGFEAMLPADEIPRDVSLPSLIQDHCDQARHADGVVLVHPNWWGQPPAILKGWVDRVLRPGVAYEFLEGDNGEGVPRGLLNAQSALVFNTGNTESQREKEVFGDPLETIWKNCIFGLCGVARFHRRLFSIIITSTPEQRAQWLEEVRVAVAEYFPENV